MRRRGGFRRRCREGLLLGLLGLKVPFWGAMAFLLTGGLMASLNHTAIPTPLQTYLQFATGRYSPAFERVALAVGASVIECRYASKRSQRYIRLQLF